MDIINKEMIKTLLKEAQDEIIKIDVKLNDLNYQIEIYNNLLVMTPGRLNQLIEIIKNWGVCQHEWTTPIGTKKSFCKLCKNYKVE